MHYARLCSLVQVVGLFVLAAACSEPPQSGFQNQTSANAPSSVLEIPGSGVSSLEGGGAAALDGMTGGETPGSTGPMSDSDGSAVTDDVAGSAGSTVALGPSTIDVDCTALVAAGHELCEERPDSCGIVVKDGSGCRKACSAAGLSCLEAADNLEGSCGRQTSQGPIDCDSGHESAYCVCGGPSRHVPSSMQSDEVTSPLATLPTPDTTSATDNAAIDPDAPLTPVQFYPSKQRQGACADATIGIEFNRTPILRGSGSIQIHDASGAIVDSVTAKPRDDLYFSDLQTRVASGQRFNSEVLDIVYNTVVFHPKSALEYGQTYYITIDEDLITDSLGTAFSIGQEDSWTFTVRPQPPAGASAYTLAADGSGDYCSVAGVLDALPDRATSTRVVTVKPGVYPGIVRMSDSNVHFLGAGIDRSVIAMKNSAYMNDDREGFELSGSDVTFENLTIFNTYLKDSSGQQAEALYVTSRSQRVFLNNVHLRSHQDTLRVDSDTVYMEGGKISGSTDPLWGTGTFYCDGCELSSRTSGHAFVVARSRKGFALVNCSVTKESESVSSTFLAQYHNGSEPGKIAFIGCRIDDHIQGWRRPEGNAWYEFNNTTLQTAESVRFDGVQLSTGSAVLSEASSAQSWLGWAP